MDPFTILASIKAANEGIKQSIALGRDIMDTAKQLSDIMQGVADLTKLTVDPPKGFGSQGSAEEIALKAFQAKKEAEEIFTTYKNQVISEHGVVEWEKLQRTIIDTRKRLKAEAVEAARRKAEDQFLATVIGFSLIGISLTVYLVYYALTYR